MPVEVISNRGLDSRLQGAEIFELLGYSVSVKDALQAGFHRFYVSVTIEENTGIAIYNPDLAGSTTLELVMFDSTGSELARKELVLEPGQHMARFVDESELFYSYFSGCNGEFYGTLAIGVLAGKTACVMGLIQKRDTGAMIAVSTD